MAIQAFEEDSPYGTNNQHPDPGPDATVSKRLRWATQRHKPAAGIQKRKSILDRFHKRTLSDKSNQSGSTSPTNETSSEETEKPASKRTIYFGQPLPDEARDEEGHPLIQYPRNKIRTAKYTPLSFVPKNLYFQFQNVANIFFLLVIILTVSPTSLPESLGLAR